MQIRLEDWNWKEDFKQLKKMFRTLLPIDKPETILFLLMFLIYGIIGIFLATQTNITDQVEGKVDAYFSFDSAYISHHGVSNFNLEGHPLINIIIYTFIYIGIIFNIIFSTVKAKAAFLVLVCAFCISSSNIFVFRYLKKVIVINGYLLYLLTFFYSLFSTNLILSFSFESFTFSIYTLTFILYYYSYAIKNNNKVSFLTSTFLAITVGGITITNFAKGIIPILFIDENKKTILRRIIIISCLFGVILITIELIFHIFSAIQDRLDLFIVKEESIYKYIIDMFLGASILFPSLIRYFPHATSFEAINIDFYHYWWQYAIIGTIFLLSFLGIARNYKNKLIYIPILFFMVDIFIHIFMKYGINEGVIYGGHWVFIVPIFIGWLYKSLNKKQTILLSLVIILLTISILANNTYQMANFITLAMKLFPTS